MRCNQETARASPKLPPADIPVNEGIQYGAHILGTATDGVTLMHPGNLTS
jgi:hypothetical protein